ncbi:hypothetical protein [Actinoplanes sp. NPDC051494]|uniref:hypothetical protein n=1 Tax=Actinoplanes sp. NPDC051494 TaxID=3363907 RepID=UPI0037B0DF94
MRLDPLHHTIIATDVAGSSARSDVLLVRMRRDLREMLDDTLARLHLDPAALVRIDDGDGFRVLLPASVPPHTALAPFVDRLAIELRMHRAGANEQNRLRLRIAVHSGLLFSEDGGTFTGTPLKDCARLLDADAGRELLADHPGVDYVVLVSDTFYQDVVRGGASFDPASFSRIRVKVKETDRDAWAYLPGVAPPQPAPAPATPGRPQRADRHSEVHITGDGTIIHGTVIGGDKNG